MRKFISANVLIAALLTATALMQAGILYRQSTAAAPASQPSVRQAPDGSTIDISGMAILGSDQADVVVVEFSDYECPFCRRHATSVFDELKNEFVGPGRIRYVFANNPLASHPNAVFLATAALCAGNQGHYWALHDRLFRDQPKTLPDLLALIEGGEIETEMFERCLDDESNANRVQRDADVARTLGLSGTPSFAVGRVGSDGRIVVDTLISGAQSLQTFQGVLKKML